MKHFMNLWNDSFLSIKSGVKDIEMRLDDEKRRAIEKGDLIEFTNVSTKETLLAKVVDLFHFASFNELYSKFDKTRLGYRKNEEPNPKDMEKYYSPDSIAEFGALGIQILVIH